MITAAAMTAAQAESRNVVGDGRGRGGRRVRGVGTSPGWRIVRGAARVSAALARQLAQLRVEDGGVGWIDVRLGAQWPARAVPAAGCERSYSARAAGSERTAHASLMRRMRSAAASRSASPSWRSGWCRFASRRWARATWS